MKTVDMIGYHRSDLGTKSAKELRKAGYVPCVIYGKETTLHFYAPMILFREIVYKPDACKVRVDIEGDEYEAILQDIQFHPVSEIIMHADFLILEEGKKVKLDVPVMLQGRPKGLDKGGDLLQKVRKLTVRAIPSKLPEVIEIDVSHLGLGKSFQVEEMKDRPYEILTPGRISIATVAIPRALRGVSEDDEEEEEGEEGEAAEEAEASEAAE